ncbi:glycosyltransferase family 4 protein [Vibrio europaeus]|uniref:glycosyltransferase family 4 protein n=1 Tax=Vibrio europaeus TaxID=300876 RepID=UPI002340F5E0|nr:glycosyltransferase family 4 protein [Vibrio europaeus]MDC5850455.1 glycosyltransferase family 4 protein [Vibrio europaeus]
MSNTKKVAFYLENVSIPNVDLSSPHFGNPGCGGTEYLFVALPYYLKVLAGDHCEPIILANCTLYLPEEVVSHQVLDVEDAARQAKHLGCQFFVYRPRRNIQASLLKLIDNIELSSIAWAHITPKEDHLRAMSETRFLKSLVCVEHEQHDMAKDSSIWKKLTYIVNLFDLNGFRSNVHASKDPNLVVYLGALVPQKGFHGLAKIWPEILKECPKAKLDVIGSGSLYGEQDRFGPWGIAEKNYEETHIIPYLSDGNGNVMSSVRFLGRLGSEKKEIISRAAVGVPNPLGQTENCPGSSLEFQALGTPVVSVRKNGLIDTVKDKETGLLSNSESELIRNICKLLRESEYSQRLGENGISFVDERYNCPKVVSEWLDLFSSLENGKRPKVFKLKNNYFDHHKYLIFANQYMQRAFGRFVCWPSVIYVKTKIIQLISKIY